MRKSIFFEFHYKPKSLLETATYVMKYLQYLFHSNFFLFDTVKIVLQKNYEIENIGDINFDNEIMPFAEALLLNKLSDIKKFHPNVIPTINFKENVGSSFFINFSYQGKGQLTYIMYLGGDRETIFIDGFKNMHNGFPYYWFFKQHCEQLTPHYGYITSSSIQKQQKLPEYFFGWMNYFSNTIKLPPIPSEYEIEPIDNIGKLIITTKENFDAVNNPDHYAKAMRLVELFREYKIVRS